MLSCFTDNVAPLVTYSESLELTLQFLALISGTKVNWDNSEFTPISLRVWFKNTCYVSFKIISFDWKYLEMFLSTGFKRCHFFMNAEMLINKIPKALTQLSGLQLFLFLLLWFVKINAIKKIPAVLLNCILSSLPPDSLTRCFMMLDTGLFALGGRLSKTLAQHHQASACDPLSQAPWTPACTLIRNQVVCSPCFKDSSGRSSYLWLPSPTLLMTAYRTWCSGPSSSCPIIFESGGWRLWL